MSRLFTLYKCLIFIFNCNKSWCDLIVLRICHPISSNVCVCECACAWLGGEHPVTVLERERDQNRHEWHFHAWQGQKWGCACWCNAPRLEPSSSEVLWFMPETSVNKDDPCGGGDVAFEMGVRWCWLSGQRTFPLLFVTIWKIEISGVA